ncbi:MAG TPA: tetratricopeptide repeat protein [Chitinivibrionales bacterium]|nr:tetratricopeptide repeat protein [Chitinivibrionales bacterium]
MKKATFTFILSVLYGAVMLAVPAQGQNSVEELMSQGNNLLKNGASTEAASVYKKILAKEPRNFEAQANLAFAYLQAERYDKAIAEYNRAISLDSRNAECWANLGFAYEKTGKSSKAADCISKSVELNPSNVEARMNLAAMYENAGAWDKAIAHYEAAIKTDAKRGDAYSGVARCMTEKGNIAGAKKYCQEAIANDPNNADAHWQLGNILWKKENKQAEALKEYETSVKLDENSQIFYENLALLQDDMGKKDEALATWKKYLIYLNDAMKKEEVQRHIDKLEGHETSASTTSKADAKANREKAAQQSEEQMQQLKSELHNEGKGETKHIDAQPVDVGSDFDKLSKDTGNALDLRQEAKKKSAAK